jgi:DNA-binding HxlR family transcriptional regulator
MKEEKKFHCPVEATLSVIGGKYKSIILYHLIEGPLRFSELQRMIPQATAKMLTQQLRELEEQKVIHRKVFPVVPPHTEYRLTKYGTTLIPVLHAMCQWGEDHLADRILPGESSH